MIKVDNYGVYSRKKNLGYSNRCQITLGDMTLYFSYRVCVAFKYEEKLYFRKLFGQEIFYPETATHLGYILKNITVEGIKKNTEEFKRMLKTATHRTIVKLAKEAIDIELNGE